ncbi:hypothetical protein, partial [Chitinilyticum litopenaei]|uniref:hypothetical protein n=1 Tax=Chitinilyticum litopenaei TaxID=1121276 RepID=UPI001B7FCB71
CSSASGFCTSIPPYASLSGYAWYPKFAVNLTVPKEWLTRQAIAAAQLTRMEMDALMLVGMDEESAWTETRTLFCLTDPPKYGEPEEEADSA